MGTIQVEGMLSDERGHLSSVVQAWLSGILHIFTDFQVPERLYQGPEDSHNYIIGNNCFITTEKNSAFSHVLILVFTST